MDSPRPLDCASFASNVVLFIQTFMLLKKYFNYPVTTKVSSKHEAITDFPSVTICNFNIIRKSVAKVNGSDQLFFTSILSQ